MDDEARYFTTVGGEHQDYHTRLLATRTTKASDELTPTEST
jgi:hypothetical protein